MKLKFNLQIKGGEVINQNEFKKNFKEYIPKLKDGAYHVEIKKARNIRSLNQNRYYWLTVGKFADHVGVSSDAMHEELKYDLLSTHFEGISGETIIKIPSTTSLNTKQMEEYLERVRKKAMEEYNLYLELPHETEFEY